MLCFHTGLIRLILFSWCWTTVGSHIQELMGRRLFLKEARLYVHSRVMIPFVSFLFPSLAVVPGELFLWIESASPHWLVPRSLDLTTGSRVYLIEPHWNPMIEEQALCRVHRVGQKRDVTTIRYLMRDSFEEVSPNQLAHSILRTPDVDHKSLLNI